MRGVYQNLHRAKASKNNYKASGDNDAANVESCLNQLHKDITGDYGTWFEIGCSLANAFGEPAGHIFIRDPDFTKDITSHAAIFEH